MPGVLRHTDVSELARAVGEVRFVRARKADGKPRDRAADAEGVGVAVGAPRHLGEPVFRRPLAEEPLACINEPTMRDLTTGPEGRVILSFAAPMLIGNVFQQLYNLTDAWVVGQFVGKEALAAVGASFSIIFLLVALIMGVTMGSGIMISQFYGAKDMERVRRTISTAYSSTCWSPPLVAHGRSGSSSAVPCSCCCRTPDGRPAAGRHVYLNIMFAGTVLSFGYNAVSAVLRALGDSRTPLYFLDRRDRCRTSAWTSWFVIGLRLGRGGRCLGHDHLAGHRLRRRPGLHAAEPARGPAPRRAAHGLRPRAIFAQSMRIGLPSGGSADPRRGLGFMALAGSSTASAPTPWRPTPRPGAWTPFAGMPAMNFAMALTTFVGQNLGARKPERVRQRVHATLLMSGALRAWATTLLMVFAKEPLIRIFNTDPAVVAIGVAVPPDRGLLLRAVLHDVRARRRAARRRRHHDPLPHHPPHAVDRPHPALHLAVPLMGTDGVWWSIPIAWVIGTVLNVGYYFTGRWRRRVLVKPRVVVAAPE